MVTQFFSELGCRAEETVTVDLVRGKKEVDVYVEDTAVEPHATYFCECKHLRRPVTQDAVHGFRTVVTDGGASLGFLVASSGFQSGARAATEKSNVRLVTFEELQRMFFGRWLTAMVYRSKPIFDELFPYWDPSGGRIPKGPWGDAECARPRELLDRYALVLRHDFVMQQKHAPTTVMTGRDPFAEDNAVVTVRTYRQYFDLVERGAPQLLAELRRLHGEE